MFLSSPQRFLGVLEWLKAEWSKALLRTLRNSQKLVKRQVQGPPSSCQNGELLRFPHTVPPGGLKERAASKPRPQTVKWGEICSE